MPKNPQVGQTTTVAPVTENDPVLENQGDELTGSNVVTIETSLIKKTLPELMSGFIKRIMDDPREANGCGHELQMWYDARPLEDRAEQIKENRKIIERAKQATEYLFSEYLKIVQKDM